MIPDPLPRCAHGSCLMDGGGERLEPPCGCRLTDSHDMVRAQLMMTGLKVASERRERLRIVHWIDEQMAYYMDLPRYGATDNSMFLEHIGRVAQLKETRNWIMSWEDEKS